MNIDKKTAWEIVEIARNPRRKTAGKIVEIARNPRRKTAWEIVEIARNPKRKTALEYIEKIFDEFIELHGDRAFKDDKSIVCGLAKIGNQNFTIIAEQKGRTTKENIERNFGMPNPESYRKAIRFMRAGRKIQ